MYIYYTNIKGILYGSFAITHMYFIQPRKLQAGEPE